MNRANALLLLLLSFFTVAASAQEDAVTKTTDSIVAEGRRLYRREMASWYGTDLFLEAYTNRENIGGYFSYTDGALARCVFFSRAAQPSVIGSITFDSTYNTRTAKVDLAERPFSSEERALHDIRQATLDLMQSDTLFQSYSNSSFNLIPLIDGVDRKVYVLTGPKREGLVVFGNDYLVSFDGNNAVTGKRRLHRHRRVHADAVRPLYEVEAAQRGFEELPEHLERADQRALRDDDGSAGSHQRRPEEAPPETLMPVNVSGRRVSFHAEGRERFTERTKSI
ncbi:hypothetical protein [Flaviaesturariibacter aridisoli]|uniref:FTP domain-containing protein n=1 Tax=Flaviaesturariibacter aridisoli TaxID=2545761 RepID=A0A4R4DXK2_9BACT|nr:hypothetical protein [Flaviaesturariibacter aridisoli]TCZ67471.1 hypothetical protein E0486_15440 [Flaviaesturariibacter aridisoli]